MEFKKLSLETVGGGAIAELFDRELEKVFENISDPNRDPTAVRSISVDVRIKPREDLETAAVALSVKSKLAGLNHGSAVFLEREDGKIVAFAKHDPNQTTIFEPVVVGDGGSES